MCVWLEIVKRSICPVLAGLDLAINLLID